MKRDDHDAAEGNENENWDGSRGAEVTQNGGDGQVEEAIGSRDGGDEGVLRHHRREAANDDEGVESHPSRVHGEEGDFDYGGDNQSLEACHGHTTVVEASCAGYHHNPCLYLHSAPSPSAFGPPHASSTSPSPSSPAPTSPSVPRIVSYPPPACVLFLPVRPASSCARAPASPG